MTPFSAKRAGIAPVIAKAHKGTRRIRIAGNRKNLQIGRQSAVNLPQLLILPPELFSAFAGRLCVPLFLKLFIPLPGKPLPGKPLSV